MRRRSKFKDFFTTLLLFGLMAFGSAWLANQSEVSLQGQYSVIDGDSLKVSGREIRLLGIDAPEYRQNCVSQKGQSYPCGKNSRTHLARLAKSGRLDCRGWEEDKYQRLLAICSAGGVELNAAMVRDGWAISYGNYEREEKIAQDKKIGVWQGGFENPKTWRESEREKHSISWFSKLSFW